MRPNVFRALGKQGTGALVLPSSRRAWLRRPLLTTFANRGHVRPAPFAAIRRFTSTRVLSDEISPYPTNTTFEDPARKGLFYHLVPPPTPLSDTRPAFAVSLLAHPPPSAKSSTILGWLPAETPGEDHDAGLNDFVPNLAGALQLGNGWMHIHDERNVPPLNRIGDPDDILASVRVEDGKIIPETYQVMPSYRICTAHGVTQLTEGLASKLQRLLEKCAREESGTADT